MIEELRALYRYREMLRNLVARELRARYKGSVLGFLWTFVNPLMMIMVYTFVFSTVLKTDQEYFSLFLFVGLLPWNYTIQSVLQGAAVMVQNANLVKKVYFPRVLLPLSVVITNLVNYLLSLLILLPALLVGKGVIPATAVAFPVVLLVQTLLLMGLVMLLSIGNVYFRDLEHITAVVTNLWFFLTPIFYSMELVPTHLRTVFLANPMTLIIESYRSILFVGEWPNWLQLGILAGCSLVFLVGSFLVFQRAQRWSAENL